MPVAVIYATIAILVAAAVPMPEAYSRDFMSIVRILAAGTFAWGAYRNFQTRVSLVLPVVYALLAVVYNPVSEVGLPWPYSIGVHLGAAVFLFFTRARIDGQPAK